jgi:glycosyltransferase involved in cell wall biosynthesis
MLGRLDSPHVARVAAAMAARGHTVHVAGDGSGSALEGVAIHPAPARIRTPLAGPALHAASVRTLVRNIRPDLVHAHFLTDFAAAAALARARPLLATAWGSDVQRPTRRQAVLRRFALRGATAITAPTPHLVERLAALGVTAKRTRRVGWGVDLSYFAPNTEARAAARRRLGVEGPVVLSPRALRPLYNPGLVLEAFERLRSELPDASLLLVDAASDRPGLPPSPEGVRVLGPVAHAEMANLYRAADAVVSVPSLDGSPSSVWEAMASARPVVVSDLPWLEGMVEANREALVVPLEPSAVASALGRLLRDRGLAERIGAAGRALVERTQDERLEMNRLSELYEELALRRRPASRR